MEGDFGLVAPASRTWGMARPVAAGTAARMVHLYGLLFVAAGSGGDLAWATVRRQASHPLVLVIDSTAAVIMGLGMITAARLAPTVVHRRYAAVFYGLLILGSIGMAIGQFGIGPRSVVAATMFVEVPILCMFMLRPPQAIASFALVFALFSGVVLLEPGYPFPPVQIVFFMVILTATGALIGGLLKDGAREADRLSDLRRFLSPAVAEAALARGSSSLLEPHRRKIAVFFCDLRGFTRFASTSEPEDVVDVLDDYFRTVGGLLHSHGATVGSFAGDGIMGYFGDPVPREDPAADAVGLAVTLREPMEKLIEVWKRRGFTLSYGIGIAYGYATLGVVGFEGRQDYTALGSVVNLAARLSDRAGGGEILLDERAYDSVGTLVDAEPCTLQLKGFDGPVPAHRIVATARLRSHSPSD